MSSKRSTLSNFVLWQQMIEEYAKQLIYFKCNKVEGRLKQSISIMIIQKGTIGILLTRKYWDLAKLRMSWWFLLTILFY